MREKHEILCPLSIKCQVCDNERAKINIEKIVDLLTSNSIPLMNKEFYLLSISLKPNLSNYKRFNINSIKTVGRSLINDLSSIGSVSNREWWSMNIDAGVRYISIKQDNLNEFPTFNVHFIVYSSKGDLDMKMDKQLKFRLNKLNRNFIYSFLQLGKYNKQKIENLISIGVDIDLDSKPVKSLGKHNVEEILKLKDQKPILFGARYNSSKIKKLSVKIEPN